MKTCLYVSELRDCQCNRYVCVEIIAVMQSLLSYLSCDQWGVVFMCLKILVISLSKSSSDFFLTGNNHSQKMLGIYSEMIIEIK